ncbi:MAG: fatty acid desaturase family protein [Planctomycetota bacterium]
MESENVLRGEVSVERTGKELLDATRPFGSESKFRSWWSAGSTVLLLGVVLVGAAVAPWWPLRLGASLMGGLLLVRAFILYHDVMHKSLFRDSAFARAVFQLFGMILLAPPRYWRSTHNFHHANVGKPIRQEIGASLLVTSDIGAFPLMTTGMWREVSFWQRLRYRVSRHPLTLLAAYVTVFFLNLSLIPLLQNPKKFWDGAVSILAHGAVVAGLCVFFGVTTACFAFLLPFTIAAAAGAYLFFAQHNYEGMNVLKPEEWTYYRGATESSSFMRMSRVTHWFTGNIGYHHLHHLNPLIPFYRLPEAMAAVPELQHPQATSLRPRDIFACLRLNLWDPERQRLVTYRDAGKT